MAAAIPIEIRPDVATLWDYHHLGHEGQPTDVGVGLGSHDIGGAVRTAQAVHA